MNIPAEPENRRQQRTREIDLIAVSGRYRFRSSTARFCTAPLRSAPMVALRRLLVVSLMAVCLGGGAVFTAPTAAALGWGAIAVSVNTGKVGYSQGFNSALEAERAAIGLCSARDCRAVVNFTKGCGAVGQAPNASWATGVGRDSAGAQRAALISCSRYGPGCRVVGVACS
ncbi:DUF4189 domain-containing protein [Mycobacterium sp. PS03-16]|uniref:DUF4189 domain-containing protein n=1 Tax=Mycobacterium sp. PS03-16 TaxID=2559611 RepID=UPI001FD7D370|nr:DUF4189 domain-containing protein [Mycobacterium sp. PS03-16]